MIEELLVDGVKQVSNAELIELLNQDLSREYMAIIAYVVYSQVLKSAEFMHVAGELEKHVVRELNHALILGEQIDYLTNTLVDEASTLSTSKKAIEMLQLECDNEAEIIQNYRKRICQCEDLAEYAVCEQIRGIMNHKIIHQNALTTALSKNASSQYQAA
ncbi:ferritin-like domain-containing protein [Telmatobacter bradus]|uniref:ferritin-like domain-containing protein n=1 Tax=Telmatobacter bradus TaxID=474953 RepID=UPI003B432149